MDIHKPKRVHSWREFAKEIGVITTGVLIALGAEQSVEALHWREQVSLATESINSQLRSQLYDLTVRNVYQDCEARQIHRLAEIVRQEGKTPQIEPIDAHFAPWDSRSWDAAIASGAVAHMRPEARQRYAEQFAEVETMAALNVQEFTLLSDLRTLETPTVLSETARDRLESDLAKLDGLNYMMGLGAVEMTDHLRGLGITLSAQQEQHFVEVRSKPCVIPGESRKTA